MKARVVALIVFVLAVFSALYLVDQRVTVDPAPRPPRADAAGARGDVGDEHLALQEGAAQRAPLSEASPSGSGQRAAADAAGLVLRGSVVDPAGNPVAGAVVGLTGVGSFDFLYQPEGSADPAIPMTTTDSAGRFELEPERVEGRAYVFITAAALPFAPSQTRYVELPGDTDDLVLVLRIGARLRGEVWRADQKPARHRRIRVLQDRSSADPLGDVQMLFITTDEHGTFDRPGIAPGEWGLVTFPDESELAELGGTRIDHWIQDAVTVPDGGDVFVTLRAVSDEPVVVRGRVTKGGAPAPGLVQWIRESPDPGDDRRTAKTDQDGSYEVKVASGGPWFVRATGSSGHTQRWVDLEADRDNTVNLEIPPHRVRGRVTDANGEPVTGATVSHALLSGSAHQHTMQVGDHRTKSGEDGSFELDALPAGDYRIGASHGEQGVAVPVEITVGGAELDDLSFVLSKGRRLEGRVVDAAGVPVPHAPVWIQSSGRTLAPITDVRSEVGGSFRTPPLAPGSYDLYTAVGTRCAFVQDVRVRADRAAPMALLRMEEGAILSVTATLNGVPQRASARAFGASGALLSGLRNARDPWAYRALPFESLRRHLGPLPRGTYRVCVEGEAAGRGEREVTVSKGEVCEVTVPLR